MKISELCIRKPVLAMVLNLVLVVLGIMSFSRLEIRFFPKLELPVVNVTTTYEGASAALMESQVTTLIENALAGIDNIQYISSSSWTGGSQITVQFRLGGDLSTEAAEVRDKVAGIHDKLPSDSDPPTVTVGTEGDPLMGIGFVDEAKKPADIRDYINTNIQPVLRQLPGVGEVDVLGSSDYAMRIWLNAAKMVSLSVTVSDVKAALTSNNIYFPAGSFQGPSRNYGIVSDTRLKNAGEFSNVIVKQTPEGTVRMRDIAKVELGYASFYNYPMRVGQQNGIMLLLKPLQSANPLDVAKVVKAQLALLQQQLPPGMKAYLTFDMSTYLKSSIDETFIAIGEAVILVIIVVSLFLGSLRAASIPIITIPVSLISVFTVVSMLGFTINTMSLLGIVLAIGLVVDDAIVMLENIHRHIEEGFSPFEAALKGSREIGFAVVAMSITLVAVYAPLGFIRGFNAALFQEFAFTLAASVLISGFVALTLSPMMCSRVLLPETQENPYMKWLDHGFLWLSNNYSKGLRRILQYRPMIIGGLLGLSLLGGGIFIALHSEFLPQEDYGVMNVSINSPTDSNMEYTDHYSKQVEAILRQNPSIDNFTSQVGFSSTQIRANMKPWGVRHVPTSEVVAELNRQFALIPQINAVASIPDIVDYGEQGSDVTLNFTTTGDYTAMIDPINKMLGYLRNFPGLDNVDTNLKFDSQQYAITINRDLAAALGVNIQDIADTINAMMSGNHWTDVQSGNRSYPVLVQMQRQDMRNFDEMNQLYVKSAMPSDTTNAAPVNMVPLSSLVTLTPSIGQGTLRHFNRLRAGAITALVAPGHTESEAINFIEKKLPSVLNPHVNYAYSGKAEEFLESSGSMFGIMLLAFVFIYLVLSAQFGSFIDPFIILLAVPLCIVGGLFALWLGGGTLNLFSEIGLVTLIGMITKHGILITQFVNDLRREGKEFTEALIEGATIRLRPILMTTAAMVFGTLPLALATGPGSASREQIGWVIVGGLLFGTFFSLVVVPIAYSYLGHFRHIPTDHREIITTENNFSDH